MATNRKQGLAARATEPVSDLVVITIADGTVDWVITDLNVRVLVVEPDLIPDGLCEQVRETPTQTLKDLDLPSAIKTKLKHHRRNDIHSKPDPTL